jgi:hypothetical protein
MNALRNLMAVLAMLPLTAFAEILTVGFNANVDSVTDYSGLLDNTIQANDTLTGSFHYDTEKATVSYIDPTTRWYTWTDSSAGIKVTSGGHVFETDFEFASTDCPTIVIISEDVVVGDLFHFLSCPIRLDDYYVSNDFEYGISFGLIDDTGTALSSMDLPTKPIDLSEWNGWKQLMLTLDFQAGYVQVRATPTETWPISETPMEQLESLLDWLVQNPDNEPDIKLTEERAYGLMQKAFEADTKFNSDVGADKTDMACNQMDAFLNQLEAFTPKFIPEAYAEEIKDLVAQIMADCDDGAL